MKCLEGILGLFGLIGLNGGDSNESLAIYKILILCTSTGHNGFLQS